MAGEGDSEADVLFFLAESGTAYSRFLYRCTGADSMMTSAKFWERHAATVLKEYDGAHCWVDTLLATEEPCFRFFSIFRKRPTVAEAFITLL